MSHVVKVHNHTFLVPKDPKEADQFIGCWVKAQNKAITKVTDEFLTNNDFSEDDFDLKVDEYTVKFYKQLKNGGKDVYRRELET